MKPPLKCPGKWTILSSMPARPFGSILIRYPNINFVQCPDTCPMIIEWMLSSFLILRIILCHVPGFNLRQTWRQVDIELTPDTFDNESNRVPVFCLDQGKEIKAQNNIIPVCRIMSLVAFICNPLEESGQLTKHIPRSRHQTQIENM